MDEDEDRTRGCGGGLRGTAKEGVSKRISSPSLLSLLGKGKRVEEGSNTASWGGGEGKMERMEVESFIYLPSLGVELQAVGKDMPPFF